MGIVDGRYLMEGRVGGDDVYVYVGFVEQLRF
jgi:hypothetical protein